MHLIDRLLDDDPCATANKQHGKQGCRITTAQPASRTKAVDLSIASRVRLLQNRAANATNGSMTPNLTHVTCCLPANSPDNVAVFAMAALTGTTQSNLTKKTTTTTKTKNTPQRCQCSTGTRFSDARAIHADGLKVIVCAGRESPAL